MIAVRRWLASYFEWTMQRQVWRGVGRLFRVLRHVSRTVGTLVVVLTVLNALLSVGLVAAFAMVIGAVPGAASDGLSSSAGQELQSWLWVYIGLLIAQGLSGTLTATCANAMTRRIDGVLRNRIMRATLSPAGVQHLENPKTRVTFDAAKAFPALERSGASPGTVVTVLPAFLASRISQLCLLVALLYLAWPVGLAFALVLAPMSIRLMMERGRLNANSSVMFIPPDASYAVDLATTAPAAKEVRVFGMGSWLGETFRTSMLGYYDKIWRGRQGYPRPLKLLLCAHGIVTLCGILYVTRAGETGALSLAAVTFCLRAIMLFLPNEVPGESTILRADDVVQAIEDAEKIARAPEYRIGGSRSADALPARSIQFEDVSFSYPGTDTEVLKELDLELPISQSVALVGINGAGKSTLVKLLCGLYAPSSGRILVDGIDLLELDVVRWRQRLAVLFQDFIRFESSALDNVRYGAVWRPADDPRAAVAQAADRAGITSAVNRLPDGWDTILAPGYEGGSSLSGGQWQRLALARVVYAVDGGAQVVVLDEPTAHLDVRAEAELYESLLALRSTPRAEPLTTVLISHRFSTVRQADRILLLDSGRITEDGTHTELMARDGQYAAMFMAQAKQFEEEAERLTAADSASEVLG